MRIPPVLLALVLMIADPMMAVVSAQTAAAHPHEEDTSAPSLRIGWADFRKLYDAGKVIVVDVRSVPSFEAGHIPKSRSIPLEQVEKHAASLKKLKRPIILYCA